MTQTFDVSQYALIYAGAQKNIGAAGVTVVIIDSRFLRRARADCPTALNYTVFADAHSLYHTPPTYPIYVCGLVCQWIASCGGAAAMERRSASKSRALYAAIDESDGFYSAPVTREYRSRINVLFTLADADLTAAFLAECDARRIVGVAGHRSVGGCRVSLYNAVELDDVHALIAVMTEFARANGKVTCAPLPI